MPPDNLWGDLSAPASETPARLLKEQARVLSDITQNVLEGIVSTSLDASGEFDVTLDIIAPALGQTRLNVVHVHHPVEPYPLRVKGRGLSSWVTCQNEVEFNNTLRQILQSSETKRSISSLLAKSGHEQ